MICFYVYVSHLTVSYSRAKIDPWALEPCIPGSDSSLITARVKTFELITELMMSSIGETEFAV